MSSPLCNPLFVFSNSFPVSAHMLQILYCVLCFLPKKQRSTTSITLNRKQELKRGFKSRESMSYNAHVQIICHVSNSHTSASLKGITFWFLNTKISTTTYQQRPKMVSVVTEDSTHLIIRLVMYA